MNTQFRLFTTCIFLVRKRDVRHFKTKKFETKHCTQAIVQRSIQAFFLCKSSFPQLHISFTVSDKKTHWKNRPYITSSGQFFDLWNHPHTKQWISHQPTANLRRRTPFSLQQFAKELTWLTFNKTHKEQSSFLACSVLLMAQKLNPDTESSW
jgi:hypothetical protein